MGLAKGQSIEIEIIDIGTEGQGIGKIDGMTIFVSGNAVMGDTVLAEITKVKKNFAMAKSVQIVKESPYRIEPSCVYADACGGCSLQNMSYEGQLILKEKQVRDKLERLAGLEDPKINPIIGMESPGEYRNKAQIAIGQDAVGFYQTKSHRVVDCKRCLIQAEPANVISEVLRQFMAKDHISAYDSLTGKGLLKQLIVRTAFGTGEVMVILVINGKGIPNHEKLIEMMDDAIYSLPARSDGITYSLESVIINVNAVAGKKTISDTINGLTFEISPVSFYQVNSVQTIKLYDKVLEYAQLIGDETVLDVYSGIGTIGLYAASKAKKVIGFENNMSAILDANRNATINGIVNAEYILGAAEEKLPELVAQDKMTADVVILDPPRAGCRPELLSAVSKASPKRIVYVSCDPATLARDVKILTGAGYEFVEATPVDMFPWSMHVETVVLLSFADTTLPLQVV